MYHVSYTFFNHYFEQSDIRYDGTDGQQITNTNSPHPYGVMGSSRGRPVAMEGGTRIRTEILDMTTLEWSPGPTVQQFHR